MDVDTGDVYLLTDNWDIDPDWSPDGNRIVFASNRHGNYEIYIMDADGSNQLRLTSNDVADTSPAWSPDGSRIAFVSNRNSTPEIFIMSADGTSVSRLTGGSSPDWSPDGNWIVFVSNYNIHIINVDGTGETNLTDGYETHVLNKFHSPSWSQ